MTERDRFIQYLRREEMLSDEDPQLVQLVNKGLLSLYDMGKITWNEKERTVSLVR